MWPKPRIWPIPIMIQYSQKYESYLLEFMVSHIHLVLTHLILICISVGMNGVTYKFGGDTFNCNYYIAMWCVSMSVIVLVRESFLLHREAVCLFLMCALFRLSFLVHMLCSYCLGLLCHFCVVWIIVVNVSHRGKLLYIYICPTPLISYPWYIFTYLSLCLLSHQLEI